MRNGFYLPTMAILAALALDFALGDPAWLPHPVRLIGRVVALGEGRLRCGRPRADLRRGGLLCASVVLATALAAWIVIASCAAVSRWLGLAVAMLLAWTTLALKGLDSAAGAVERALDAGRDGLARAAMPALVGRDPAALDR